MKTKILKRLSSLIFPLIVLFSCSKPAFKNKLIKENILYDKAFEFREQGRIDSAFSYFNQAKDLFLVQNDSLGAGKCLVNMGIISTDRGDYFGGQEISLNAIKYFDNTDKKQHPYIHSNYNNVGIASAKLADYSNALKFYNLAINYANKPFDINLYLNNKAKIYQDTKNFKESLKIYNQILSKNSDNPKEYARALSNLAKTKWLINPEYNAEPEFLKALNIRLKENDLWGLNASYAHLSDFYSVVKPTNALDCAEKMYNVAKKIKSADDQLEALQKLINIGSPSKIKQYFKIYYKLDDSLQSSHNAAKNQFALIRYDTERSKADNLVLQKDNEGKRYQIVILIIGILLIIIAGTLWYKKRKQRLELEAQNSIRENKLQTSQKVHDVVANGLYRIMSKLDNQVTLKDNPIVNEIEELYEQSRDISYERPKLKNQSFNEKISETLKSFASENTRVILVGNSAALWEKVSEQAKDEVEHVLQELMVNMGKHSQANDVVIKFEQVQQTINIYYTDNGVGIAGKPQPKNGLTNTGSRIDAIGGTITFDTKVEKGLKIQISFPVS
jgi:signal transduction histidine kinase